MEYYPVYLKLKNERCLVVGGGVIALRKIESLINAGAKVNVVAPDCEKEIIDYSESGLINLILREFMDSDIEGCSLVIGATNYPEVNKRIYELARERKIPVNIVDCPELCSFIVPSIVDRGRLLISISTQGASPAFARSIRKILEKQFGEEYDLFLNIMEEIRKITSPVIHDQKSRQTFYEAIIDSELLTLCKEKDAEKIVDCINGILKNAGISDLSAKIEIIVNSILKN